jgi:signal transduction histidine kinase
VLRTFVLQHRQEILRRCIVKMRQRHPALEETEVIPPLNELLDQMTALRRRAESSPRPRLPGEVVHEIGSVCDVIMELAAESQAPIDGEVKRTLHAAVDQAAAAVLNAFSPSESATGEPVHELGSVFHEVRNALGTAMLAFRMIRAGRAPVDGRTADIVARSHQRIHELVSRTLMEVRLGTARPVHLERVRLAPLLSDIGTSAFPDRDIQITVEVETGLEVAADVRLLSSAIENLVQNAVKFTRSGEGVTLRSWPMGDGAVIEVEDRCGGLPPGRPDDLFDPFVQKTSNRAGLGLGLTIVQRAVEAHGGRVSVRNLPGVGCVFRIELPGAVVAAPG